MLVLRGLQRHQYIHEEVGASTFEGVTKVGHNFCLLLLNSYPS